MSNDQVTGVETDDEPVVDFHQDKLFSDPVDDTASYVPHDTWSLFGDQIHQED